MSVEPAQSVSLVSLVPIDWAGVSAIVSIIGITAIAIGVWSLVETQKSRSVDVLSWAFSEMKDIKPTLDALRNLKASGENITSNAEYCQKARDASNVFMRLSIMMKHKLIDEKVIGDVWGIVFWDTWVAVRPWVEHERANIAKQGKWWAHKPLRYEFETYAKKFHDQIINQSV